MPKCATTPPAAVEATVAVRGLQDRNMNDTIRKAPEDDDARDGARLRALTSRHLDTLSHVDDPAVARVVDAIRQRHGERVAAILLYGSYLRGKRDTLLDFYVLLTELSGALPGRVQEAGNRLLPPNVYYLSLPEGVQGGQRQTAVRAKYATLSLRQFERGMRHFHGYFWARFVQPAGLPFVRDDESRQRVAAAVARSVDTFVRRVAPMLPDRFDAAEFWRTGFALTYECELRSEQPPGIAGLFEHNQRHFEDLLAAYAEQPDAAVVIADGAYRRSSQRRRERAARFSWSVRRVQGKVLSVLRLVKAAGTFDDPLDYLLWKLERHSGIYIAPTERQRRHPLIFAWGLLWRLYRRGAFR
jgi:hypothetical protein